MTVVSVNAISSSCTVGNRQGEREYVTTYRVVTDSGLDGPVTSRDAPGIPQIGSTYTFGGDFDTGAYASSYTSSLQSEDESYRVWQVDVNYTTAGSRRCDTDFENNPLLRKPVITLDGIRYEGLTEVDKDDNPITNTAGTVRPLPRDYTRQILRITKFQPSIDTAQLREFTDSLNDSDFFGLTSEMWKMSFPRIEELYQNCTAYYRVSYEFETRGETEWTDLPIDKGPDEIVEFLGEFAKVKATDDYGQPVGEVLLNGINGKRLDEVALGLGTTVPQYVPDVIRIYPTKDWTQLNIPQDWGET